VVLAIAVRCLQTRTWANPGDESARDCAQAGSSSDNVLRLVAGPCSRLLLVFLAHRRGRIGSLRPTRGAVVARRSTTRADRDRAHGRRSYWRRTCPRAPPVVDVRMASPPLPGDGRANPNEPSSDAELIAALQEANAALRKTNAGLREVINTQVAQIETLTRQVEALSARIAQLERRLGSDSTTSSKPPSSDPPYRKPERRSSRTASGRRPGKQPGTGGTTMPLVDNPDETRYSDVDRCADCGGDLTGAPVARVQRRQVTDVSPPPPPRVTEYRIITRVCHGGVDRRSSGQAGAPTCFTSAGPVPL
jgi:hypothetical protein